MWYQETVQETVQEEVSLMNETLKQFLLELGRVVVLAVIPVVLNYLGTIDTTTAIVAVGILRAVDRGLHESGKVESGITRF